MQLTGTPAADDAAASQFSRWLDAFTVACAARDAALFEPLFVEDSYWKDILSLTGGFRTYGGRDAVVKAWTSALAAVKVDGIRPDGDRLPPRQLRRSARDVIEAFFAFETDQGHATAFVRLQCTQDGQPPKAWLFLTTLQSLHGYEERIGERRPTGVEFSRNFAGDNWLDLRRAAQRYDDRDPEVLIVGAGQGGLSLAARLGQMGADVLVVEKLPRVGDNWRRRYHSLTLHNEVWANSLPYMPFPDTWPTFVPKDKLAGWLEAYAEAMELNVWTSTEMLGASFDEESERWTVELRDGEGNLRRVRPAHLVMAVGGSTGTPNMPQLPGSDEFAGEVLHSSKFAAGETYAGKHAVVFGTGVSGHDVAQDLYSNGAASVTLVQRGPTCVVSLVPSGTMVYAIYSEGPPEDMDLITAAIPYDVLRDTYQFLTKRTCAIDAELLDRLREVGFKLDFGHDNTGFHMMYLRKGGGYYIDVGCSELIADGKVRLTQWEDIDRLVPEGVRRTDGSVTPADLIVMATGYGNLQNTLADKLGPEVAERVGPVWGFDENYTMRNMWQRTAQPGFWIMGGALVDARLYSRFLAVQIVSELRDVALPSAPQG
jgi:cation diffusion facilitator CzcD-associated flavoprotein CzcO